MSIVVVGGGHAAGHVVGTLRMNGYDGPIRIVGEEPVAPYQRPPLSKSYLARLVDPAEVYLRPLEFYSRNAVALALGCRVEKIDRSAKAITTSHGVSIPYTKLVLATGARIRRLALPGSDLCGIHCLRTMADANRIREDLSPGKRLVICGGGYIGLEVAAVAARIKAIAMVLEMTDRVMKRVVAPLVSAFFQDLHAGNGVEIMTGIEVVGFEGRQRVERVVTADGQAFPADVVVVGTGVVPNVELAETAGLPCNDGILVDARGQTEDPDILACGDCTNHPNGVYRVNVRLESVQNAVDQATIVARALCGMEGIYNAVPWFWSDQYDTKLQIAGLSANHDQAVVRGDPADGAFSVFYLKDGRLVAVDAVNGPREYMMGRKLIASGASPAPERIADPASSLKTLAGQ